MMAIDTEKVMDAYTENVWAFSKSLIALVVIGWLFEFATDIESTAFKGAGIAFCMVMYIPYILYQMVRADADDKRYAVEEANEAILQAKATVAEALKQRGDVIKIATTLKEKANALQEKANTLGDECGCLRASEQTLLQKMQTLKADLQTLEDEKQTLESKLANAQILQANAIANAKADALKPYRPYIEAGENYLLYAVAKAMSNHNSSYSDSDKARAGEQAKALKSSLDAFRDEYRAKAEKVVLG